MYSVGIDTSQQALIFKCEIYKLMFKLHCSLTNFSGTAAKQKFIMFLWLSQTINAFMKNNYKHSKTNCLRNSKQTSSLLTF